MYEVLAVHNLTPSYEESGRISAHVYYDRPSEEQAIGLTTTKRDYADSREESSFEQPSLER